MTKAINYLEEVGRGGSFKVASCICLAGLINLAASETFAAQVAIEEVVVSAQKRDESLQEVPIAISAVSGDVIERSSLGNIADLAGMVPSLGFTQGADARSSSIRIRGVGTQTFPVGVEASTAVILDGLVMARPTAAFSKLSDIERVEVLRGPQGTLFGKNSSAGGVHVITKRPNTEQFEGYAKVLIAEDGEYQVQGAVSAPLSDTVAYRVNGYTRSFDGYVENLSGGDDLGADDSWGLKGQLLLNPTDALSIRLGIDTEVRDTTNSATTWRYVEDSVYTTATGTPVGKGVDKTTRNIDANYSDLDTWGFSAEVNYDIGGYSLTYVGGVRSWIDDHSLDQDYTSVDAVSLRGGEIDVMTLQHELRLASPAEGRGYDYVLGLFYYEQESDRDFRTAACRRADLLDPLDPLSIDCADPRDGGYITSVDSTNMAIFGQINFHPTENLTFLLGFRGIYEEQDFTYYRGGLNGLKFINQTATRGEINPPFKDNTDDTGFIGKAGVSYAFENGVNTYATISTGYKGKAYFNAGGILDSQLLGTGSGDQVYPLDPETSISYELGMKGMFYDDRLQLNVALFRTEFDDFQAQVNNPETLISLLINAGQVVTQGIEVEFQSLVTERFSLFGGFTYLEATFEDFDDFPIVCPGPLQGGSKCFMTNNGEELINVEGYQIENAPELSLSLSGRYEFNLFENYLAFTQADYRWTDKVQYGIDQDPRTTQGAYGILDLSFGAESLDGRYELRFFVKNVLDKEHYNSVEVEGGLFNPSGSANGVVQILPRDFNRYMGASFRVNF